jgi:hypothetical protein
MKISIPSLEIRWLKYPKIISPPTIVIVDELDDYSGCYIHPQGGEAWVDGSPHTLRDGLIVASAHSNYESTIAHEFRHHMQYVYVGMKFDSKPLRTDIPYRDAIVKYFTNSMTEMDALQYEMSKVKSDVCMEWYEWIMDTDNRVI